MKVNVYTSHFNLTEPPAATSYWLSHFGEGLKKHGHDVNYESIHSLPSKADMGVLWGIRNHAFYPYHIENNIPVLVIERGFTPNRSEWCMAGFNGLNGIAEYMNQDMPSDRWDRYHAHKLKPWSTHGDYALILGQTQGDSALYGVDIDKWAIDTQTYFKRLGIPYMFRPHPGAKVTWMDSIPDLEQAIDGAYCVVTYNSSAGVEAIMRGKPTISMHKGSMVWDITKHRLSAHGYKFTPDRNQWGANFAYTQWRAEEMLSGEAWDHLKSYFK